MNALDINSNFGSPAALIGQAQDAQAVARQARAAAAVSGAESSKGVSKEKIREAAEGFEGLFIGQMLQHMWTDLDVNPEFGGGHGEQAWRSMLIDEYGKQISKTGKLGIADSVMKVMLQAQEDREAGKTKLASDTADATTGAESTAAATAVAATIRR
jgi:flagellar protein FlgJ